jgi:sporulation protein YlmC with PRC-barrel domain
MRSEQVHMLSASTIIGDGVRNREGENLGTIKDLVMDLDDGGVVYAVLSFGGFLGMGDKLFAVPWEALQVDMESHVIRLDVTRDRLENAPGFDKDSWPERPDREFIDSVYTHYGYEPYSGRHNRQGTFAGAEAGGSSRSHEGLGGATGASDRPGGTVGDAHRSGPGSIDRDRDDPTRGDSGLGMGRPERKL